MSSTHSFLAAKHFSCLFVLWCAFCYASQAPSRGPITAECRNFLFFSPTLENQHSWLLVRWPFRVDLSPFLIHLLCSLHFPCLVLKWMFSHESKVRNLNEHCIIWITQCTSVHTREVIAIFDRFELRSVHTREVIAIFELRSVHTREVYLNYAVYTREK